MKNNSGFILVETIVTAVFVLGLSTFLIANILPLVGDYERSMEYDSIDSKYDAHMIRKMILKDGDYCRVKNLLKLEEYNASDTSGFHYVFEGDQICEYLSNINYCKLLLSKEYLDVNQIILTEYNVSGFKDKAGKFERPLSDYINNMPNYSNTPETYFYRRRLIIYFNDGRITNIEVLLQHDDCAGELIC